MNKPTIQNKGKKKMPASAKGGLIAGMSILLAYSLTVGCLIPFQNCTLSCIAGAACLTIPFFFLPFFIYGLILAIIGAKKNKDSSKRAINKSPQKNTYLQALRWSIVVFLVIGSWVAFIAGGQYIINAIICLVAAIMLAVIPGLKGR